MSDSKDNLIPFGLSDTTGSVVQPWSSDFIPFAIKYGLCHSPRRTGIFTGLWILVSAIFLYSIGLFYQELLNPWTYCFPILWYTIYKMTRIASDSLETNIDIFDHIKRKEDRNSRFLWLQYEKPEAQISRKSGVPTRALFRCDADFGRFQKMGKDIVQRKIRGLVSVEAFAAWIIIVAWLAFG
ncbi:MAG: hypothetical protein P1Q69_20575, partial [Candidatus Thorarchaeota archaeon]|nr:hypothetical protein [Candidatus Thorarchaeota archaeon]